MEITHSIHTLEEMLNAPGGCRSFGITVHAGNAHQHPDEDPEAPHYLIAGKLGSLHRVDCKNGGHLPSVIFALFGACLLHLVEGKNGAHLPSVLPSLEHAFSIAWRPKMEQTCRRWSFSSVGLVC